LLSFGAESFAFHFAIQTFKDKDIQNYNVACFFYGCETSKEEPRLRLFENRVLKIIFGPKRDEVTENRRKLQSEEHNELYSSPNIIRVIKSRRMRWAGHVARMGVIYTGFWWVNLREIDHLEVPDVDRRIILRCIFWKWDGVMDGIDLAQGRNWLRALVNAIRNRRVP